MLFSNSRHYLILAWILILSIIILSLLPGSSLPKFNLFTTLPIDKIGHFTFYGFTAWSFMKYYTLQNRLNQIPKNGLYLFLLGIAIECMQYEMKMGRHFDLFDILANGFGILGGIYLFDLVFKRIALMFNKA